MKAVALGFLQVRFTPNDINNYYVNLLKEDDATLFVMKDKLDLFQNNKLMFPNLCFQFLIELCYYNYL